MPVSHKFTRFGFFNGKTVEFSCSRFYIAISFVYVFKPDVDFHLYIENSLLVKIIDLKKNQNKKTNIAIVEMF